MDVQVHAVAAGVWHARAKHVGWVLIGDGTEVTLVDTGYPGDRAGVLRSLERIGRKPSDVAAVVLTHAHTDHLGSAEYFRAVVEKRVLVHPYEVDNATGHRIEQVSRTTVLARGWRPSTALWARDRMSLKAEKVERLASVDTFESGPLDLPGRPLPVHTPGHTSGHCAFHLLERGVLLVGDALMTEHAVVRRSGPQLMPSFFHADPARARDSLRNLAWLEAHVVVPGHGPAFRGSPAIAIDMALDRS